MSRDFYSFGGGWRWLQNLNGELNCNFFYKIFYCKRIKFVLLFDIRLVQDNLFVKDQKSLK